MSPPINFFFFFLSFPWFNEYFPAKLNSSLRCVWENHSQEYFLAKMRNRSTKVCRVTYVGNGQLFLSPYPSSLLWLWVHMPQGQNPHNSKRDYTELQVLRVWTVGQENLSLTFGFQAILIAGCPGFQWHSQIKSPIIFIFKKQNAGIDEKYEYEKKDEGIEQKRKLRYEML